MNMMVLAAQHRAQGMGALGNNDDWFNANHLPSGHYPATGGGAKWWEQIIQPVAAFGNNFLSAWAQRGAYSHGINPNAPATGYNFNPNTLTPAEQQQLLAQQQALGLAPGSQISGRLSQGWAQLAGTLGISSGTLTLVTVAGVGLLFLKPPGRRGKGY